MTYIGLVLSAALSSITVSLSVPDGDIATAAIGSNGLAACLPFGYAGTEEGFPDMPVYPEWVALPEGSAACGIELVSAEWVGVPGRWMLRPLPAPAILSRSGPVPETPRAPGIYETDAFWPASPVRLAGTGFRNGSPCAEIVVSPLRFNPETGELERLVSCEISVETRPASRSIEAPKADDGPETMLIITGESIRAPFDSLASWRSGGGILTEVVTTDEVYTWPGADNMERIRNYIRDRWTTDGIDYVLLGGDTGVIPCRYAFALSYETGGGRDDSLPCDLYYSDLDGDWNHDGDDLWGELADSVDLYSDVFVGRAPVDNLTEAWTFVDKTIAYESVPYTEHLDDALLIAAVMWDDPYTDGGVLGDWLEEHCIPDFFDITKQYESQGTYGTAEAILALNQGVHYMCIISHGWYTGVGPLDMSAVDAVDSDGRLFGMASASGCWTNAFDLDTVAEHFLNNPDGCGVSYIGNSSYGWGSPGNPLFGYSDKMDREIFRILFEDPTLSLGELVTEAKNVFTPFSRQENVYRCILYIVNLLGDPSLVTHRMTPVTPVLMVPDIVTPNTEYIPVTAVTGTVDPEAATICIHGPGFTNYSAVSPDASGHLVALLEEPPTGDITVTITGPNIARTSVAIPFASGPSLVLESVSIDDTAGYGHLSPGAGADLVLTLGNQGTVALTGVELAVTLEEGPAEVVQPTVSYGDMPVGTSGTGDGAIGISVDSSAVTGEVVRLRLSMTSGQGSWTFDLPLLVYAPGLCISTCSIDDTAGGNGNGYAEAGESFDLLVDLANIGLLQASGVTASIPDGPSWLEWTSSTSGVALIPPDGTGTVVFSGTLSPSAPSAAFPEFEVSLGASPSWTGRDTLVLIVGDMGISEDVESGSTGWSHSGTGDLWHITTAAGHSGTHSWYCADETGGQYTPSMDAILASPQVYLAPNAELTFWSRFDLALYGADGLYVILRDLGDMTRDTLDFIGTGGLLGTGPEGLRNNMQWLPRSYDLSGIAEPGTLVRLEFGFHSDSDSDVGPGFWIDDISFDGCYHGSVGVEGDLIPGIMSLGSPSPNPGSGSFVFHFTTAGSPWSVCVYDLSGRLVVRNTGSEPFSGEYRLSLPDAVPGVYFVRAQSGGRSETRSLVILD